MVFRKCEIEKKKKNNTEKKIKEKKEISTQIEKSRSACRSICSVLPCAHNVCEEGTMAGSLSIDNGTFPKTDSSQTKERQRERKIVCCVVVAICQSLREQQQN